MLKDGHIQGAACFLDFVTLRVIVDDHAIFLAVEIHGFFMFKHLFIPLDCLTDLVFVIHEILVFEHQIPSILPQKYTFFREYGWGLQV